jgi:hypothetical protein
VDLPQDQRLRVWAALSWPYLDTEPSEKDWARAAAGLMACGLHTQTLKRLQATLVAPVLRGQAMYGRWIPLSPNLDDPDTAAIERSWAVHGLTAPLSPWRRWWWRWRTSAYWNRIAEELDRDLK